MINSLCFLCSIKGRTHPPIRSFTRVSMTEPVSSLAFYTAIISQLTSIAHHQLLAFEGVLAMRTAVNCWLGLEKRIIFLQVVAAISFGRECRCRSLPCHKPLNFKECSCHVFFSILDLIDSTSCAANPAFRDCGKKVFWAASMPGGAPLNTLTIVAVDVPYRKGGVLYLKRQDRPPPCHEHYYLENRGEDFQAQGYKLSLIYQ